MSINDMTDAELAAGFAVETGRCEAAWAAWEVARDAGGTLFSPEWSAHGEAQAALDVFSAEIQRRDLARRLRLLAPLLREPLSGPEWEAAWVRGPGSDAR
jgi:hypothetical protein